MTVYVVEEGEYSDRRVMGIFSTKEKADKYIELKNFTNSGNEPFSVHEWEIDEGVFYEDTVTMVLINNKIYNLNKIQWKYDWLYNSINEGNKIGNVRELNFSDIEGYDAIWDLNWEETVNMVSFPIYIVYDVPFNKNFSVMQKTVYDSVAKYNAEREGL